MSLTEGTRLGPYEIVGLLGAGGMGEVYRARDPRLGRSVAIKILPAAFSTDSDRLWRFEREARAVASLNHPNICTIHDIGEHDGHRYLVMELLEGMTLSSTLETGPLPAPKLIELATQIADALDAAHGAGIIHRDLKPANIFITKRGEAKLLDFGLAKLTEDGGGDGTETGIADPADAPTLAGRRGETTVGTLLGTAAYMSPEQARGEPADAQSDLFSFGVVLYEMATGRAAFSGKTMAVLFDGILNKDPRPITELNPQIPVDLVHIVAKALEKEKDLRYRSAADMRADLKRLRRDSTPRQIVDDETATPTVGAAPSGAAQPTSAVPVPTPPSPPVNEQRPQRRQRRQIARFAVLLILIVVIGRAGLRRRAVIENRTAPSIENLQVTQLTSTGNAARPAISPDGRYVVYLQVDGDGSSSVWLRQTGTTNSVKILQSDPASPALGVTVGPDSTFVDVWRGNKIWRVPFLGGSAKQIVDRSNTPIGWSPDGQRMTFVRSAEAGGQELVVADRNGENIQVVAGRNGVNPGDPRGGFATGLPGVLAAAPAWSPDGGHIAALQRLGEDVRDMGVSVFEVSNGNRQVVNVRGDVPLGYGWLDRDALVVVQSLEQGTPSQVWRVNVSDSQRSRLTNDVSRYAEMSLTGDAATFVTARPETRAGIWVGNVRGEGRDVLNALPFLSNAVSYAGVAWDGDHVLFTHTLNGKFEIFRMNADGSGTPEPVVAGRDLAVGAEGQIAFRSVTGDDMGLWKVDRDGQHPIQLAKGSVNFPMSSPDGGTILFSSPAGGPQSLWQVPLAGGLPAVVKTSVGIYAYSNLSPDGHSIVIVHDGRWVICDFPACANRTPFGFRGSLPKWMPDGRGISYIDSGPMPTPGTTVNLWVQPIDGSAARQLTHFDDHKGIGQYAWARDGRLVMSRTTSSSDIVLFKGLKGK